LAAGKALGGFWTIASLAFFRARIAERISETLIGTRRTGGGSISKTTNRSIAVETGA